MFKRHATPSAGLALPLSYRSIPSFFFSSRNCSRNHCSSHNRNNHNRSNHMLRKLSHQDAFHHFEPRTLPAAYQLEYSSPPWSCLLFSPPLGTPSNHYVTFRPGIMHYTTKTFCFQPFAGHLCTGVLLVTCAQACQGDQIQLLTAAARWTTMIAITVTTILTITALVTTIIGAIITTAVMPVCYINLSVGYLSPFCASYYLSKSST